MPAPRNCSQSCSTFRDGTVEPVCLLGSLAGLHSAGRECARNPGPAGANREVLSLLASSVRGGVHLVFRDAGSKLFLSRRAAGRSKCECPFALAVLSLAVRSIIIVFVLSIVFEELGMAEQTMLIAFGIAFGALMLGLGNCVWYWGRDLARRFLEKRFVREKKEENEDELSPL